MFILRSYDWRPCENTEEKRLRTRRSICSPLTLREKPLRHWWDLNGPQHWLMNEVNVCGFREACGVIVMIFQCVNLCLRLSINHLKMASVEVRQQFGSSAANTRSNVGYLLTLSHISQIHSQTTRHVLMMRTQTVICLSQTKTLQQIVKKIRIHHRSQNIQQFPWEGKPSSY